MKNLFPGLILMGLLTAPAFAVTLVFTAPSGDLGTTENYTFGTATLTADAFNGGNLFSKSDGAGEEGVGLTGNPRGHNEIWFAGAPSATVPFIQLDLADLIAEGYSNFMFAMDSTTDSESWAVFGCTTSGFVGCGTAVTGSDQGTYAAPGTARYLTFFSTNNNGGGDVLLHSLTADKNSDAPGDVPEPTSILLLGSALAGLAWIRRRARI